MKSPVTVPVQLLTNYIDQPVAFIQDTLLRYSQGSVKPVIWPHQWAALMALRDKEFVTIRSGRGRGKSALAAWTAIWFLATRPSASVVCVAPKADQIFDVLWKETAKWLHPSPLRELLHWSKEKIEVVGYENVWYAVARTAKTKEGLSGYHAKHQMFIIDEASGVADDILETIEATQLSNKKSYGKEAEIRTLLISNPNRVTGYFYKTHKHEKWEDRWKRLHFKQEQKGLTADDRATIDAYGIDHDVVQVSIFGEFPSGNPRAVIPYNAICEAEDRDLGMPMDETPGEIELGVDVARFGDDSTVIYARKGYRVLTPWRGKKEDTVQTTEKVLTVVRELRKKFDYKSIIRVKIDDTGIGGSCVDQLRRNVMDGLDVIPVTFGGSGDDHYGNHGSIMWADAGKMMEKLEIPRDDFLREELAGRNWEASLDNRGRQIIESKADFKKRIHRSPDSADAFVMCCSNQAQEQKILPRLVHIRETVYKADRVRFDYVPQRRVELFGSIWHEKNMEDSVLLATWDKEMGQLLVFYEGFSNFGGPGSIVRSLNEMIDMYNKECGTEIKARRFMWYGNRGIFGLTEQASEFNKVKDGPYLQWERQHQIYIQPNFYWDLDGSILELNKMVNAGRLNIYPDCEQLKMQLETWSIDGGRPDNASHALCLALCNLVSILVQTKRMEKPVKVLREYSGDKDAFLKKFDKLLEHGSPLQIRKYLPSPSNPLPTGKPSERQRIGTLGNRAGQ